MSTKAMEIMFKSLGLGDAMAGVDRLIQSGAIDKVVKFSDDAEAIKQEIRDMRIEVAEIYGMLRVLINGLETHTDSPDSASSNGVVLRTVDAPAPPRGLRLEFTSSGVNRATE